MDVRIEHPATRGSIYAWGDEGLYLPERFLAHFDEPGRAALVEVEIRVMNGQPRCIRLTCTARQDGDVVSAELVKNLPVTQYVRIAASHAALRGYRTDDGFMAFEPVNAADADLLASEVHRVGRRHRILTENFLRQVASVYEQNRNTAPTQAVAEHFFTSRQNAGKWVKRAEEQGYLNREGLR